MLTEHHKCNFIDQSDKHAFTAEVNWEPDNEKTNNSKIVKLHCEDGKYAYIKREHLLEFLFAIGQPEDQQKMIPQTLTSTRWYETVLSIKATKNIRKGEEIVFPIKLSLPPIEQEIIAEAKRTAIKTNIPLVGNNTQ